MHVLQFMTQASATRAVAEFLLRPRPQFWLVRLYLSASILVTASIAYYSPFGYQRIVLDGLGDDGWMLHGVIAALAALCLIDSVINDVLPERFRIAWTDYHRHQVYMTLSLLLWGLIFLNVMHYASPLLVARYAIDGMACTLVAVFDTVARYRAEQRTRRSD